MPERNCDVCDKLYTYERSNSKYCTERCRYNANNAVNGRMRVPDTLRFSILHRDGFACRFCGRRPPHSELQLDHVKTLAEGGAPLDPNNLIVTCARCNNGHGDTSVEIPESIIALFWDLMEYPPEEWIEVNRIRLVQLEDGTYELEAE